MPTEHSNQMDKNPPNFAKKLMCIEYPGRVKNVSKMIRTLGGVENIGTAYGTKNRRVELRFRPDDLYCKPACGERNSTTGLLIKVKVKKHSRDPNSPCSSREADEPQTITYETSLIGVVDTIYKFDNICDFQYLPIDLKKGQPDGGKSENIYGKLLPSSVPAAEWLNDDSVPYYLTPPVFSRFDTVHYYNAQKVKDTDHDDPNIIGRTRRRRTGHAIFLNYKDEQVPRKPHPESLKMLQIKFMNEHHFEIVKQLFDERPVWSKNGLMHRTNFSKDQLKFLLPTVAYYFLTGPWRVMWIRYGYDPRLTRDAYRYQTFDYRLRTIDGMKNKVKAKRSYSNYLLPYKSSPSSRPKVAIINRHSLARAYRDAREAARKEPVKDNTYMFRPGMIPPTRQMFYQYCDVLVPEIQDMLQDAVVATAGSCDSRMGWLPKGFDGRCREIVNSLISTELRKLMKEDQLRQAARAREPQQQEEPVTTTTTGSQPEEIEISDSEEEDELLEVCEDDIDTDGIIDSDMEESMDD